MMKRLLLFLVYTFLWIGWMHAQTSFSVYTIASYNSFSMASLKDMQKEILNTITSTNIPAKIVESYPSYYGFKMGILFPLTDEETYTISIGGIGEYTSTGARIHYQDYSGEIRIDETASVLSIGCVFDYRLKVDEKFWVSFQWSARYFYSTLSYSMYSQLGSFSSSETPEFHCASFGLEPSIMPACKIFGAQVGLSLSYLIFLPSLLEYDDYPDAYLTNNAGEKVKIDWSGFRIGVVVGLSL